MTLKPSVRKQAIASKAYLTFTLFTNLLGIISILVAANYKLESIRYEAAYQRIRGDIEALYRTVGKGVDNNYSCKLKSKAR